ncbi:MAG: hypothetical protein KH366_17830 [Clostridiaceae bacterium]|nr:hypothetical protein [Clostridiaceae bacterium]
MAKTGRINFGGGGGIDPDELNALPEHVLTGKSFGGSGSDEPQTGNMPNRGAVTQALNAGGSYTIPNGYHNGSGKITANSLASQTSATATAGYIYNGKTAWVNGSKITGNMTVGSILNFSAAAYSTTQILLKWQNPYAATGKPFSGVFINYSTGGYPGIGGTRIYTGVGNNTASGGWSQVIVNMPSIGTGYYFSCSSYCTCSAGQINGNTLNAYAATLPRGQQIFTQSGTFTVPANVRTIDVFCVGAGGIAYHYGVSSANVRRRALGGGGGYTTTQKGISVSPGAQYPVVVGASTTDTFSIPSAGTQSGTSSFGSLVSAAGGWGGRWCMGTGVANGQNGGSGGGAYWASQNGAIINGSQTPGVDGSDGGSIRYWWDSEEDGYQEGTATGGIGQRRTTRAFGEASGSLYSSAGTNGGNKAGDANTGNGGSGMEDYSRNWQYGGSGIVIVRWGY